MALHSEKELQQLKNRLRDLADKSFTQSIFTFTGFLGLSEQEVFWQAEQELRYASCRLWGGKEGAQRCVLRFGSPDDLGYEEPFPIVCLHMKPLHEKFSDDFSHRDFLGALMNLGIERSTIGDILVGDMEGYLFCLSSIAEYICEHLVKVRHTSIRCRITENLASFPEEQPGQQDILISSERADAFLAKVYNKSRKDALTLFQSGRVYINGRLCENNARLLKEGDTVNARGYGKFIYSARKYETKKGKLCAQVAIYR